MALALASLVTISFTVGLAPSRPATHFPAATAPTVMMKLEEDTWRDTTRRAADAKSILRQGVAVLGSAAIIGAALPSSAALAPPVDLPTPVARHPPAVTRPATSTPRLARRSRRDDASDVRAGSDNQAEQADIRVQDVRRPWGSEVTRQKGGRLTDDANLIAAESRDYITRTIRTAEEQTNTEMVVVTLPSIGSKSQKDVKRFATELFNEWGIGRDEPNNGVLVLVVKDARRIEVEVGDGAAARFRRSWTDEMIESKVLPSFKAGDFSRGLERCVDACTARLDLTEEDAAAADMITGALTAVQLLFSLAFGGLGGGSGGSGSGGGGSGYSSGGSGGGGSW